MTCCNESNTLNLGCYPSCAVLEIPNVSSYTGEYSIRINWNNMYMPIQKGTIENNTDPFLIDLTKINENGCFTAQLIDSADNLITQMFNLKSEIVSIKCYSFKTIIEL